MTPPQPLSTSRQSNRKGCYLYLANYVLKLSVESGQDQRQTQRRAGPSLPVLEAYTT
jgi:hypothetical protein